MPRASRTALKVARFMLMVDATPRLAGVLPPGSAAACEAILRASGAVHGRVIDATRQPWMRRMAEVIEGWTVRGQVLWFGLRKRWIADRAAAAIADGAMQVLVVGAGFDPLAALLAARHPDVLCVEIDAPETAEPKLRGLRGAGLVRGNLHVCAADLATRPLGEVLATTPWRPEARSLVVAEGLLMYLDAATVREFLAALRGSTGAGTRVACSSMYADDRGAPRLVTLNRLSKLALRVAGEPLLWGVAPEDLAGFVAGAGFRVREQAEAADLRAQILAPLGLPDEPVAPYEHLALLEHD